MPPVIIRLDNLLETVLYYGSPLRPEQQTPCERQHCWVCYNWSVSSWKIRRSRRRRPLQRIYARYNRQRIKKISSSHLWVRYQRQRVLVLYTIRWSPLIERILFHFEFESLKCRWGIKLCQPLCQRLLQPVERKEVNKLIWDWDRVIGRTINEVR